MRIRGLMLTLAVVTAACGSNGDGDGGPDDAVAGTTAPATSTVVAAASATTDGSPAVPTTASSSSDVSAHPCDGGEVSVGGTDGVLVSGGNEYHYVLFVPTSYDGGAWPLVMDFHGLGSDGPGQGSASGYQALALREEFFVVHPTGIPAPGSGQNSWELAQFDVDGRDDVQMVADLIDRVSEMVCVDPARVYATGLSNGGYFSALLVCELADRIAATFSVAAISHPDGCQPSRPVAMGALHGTADEVVPFNGGGESSLMTDDLLGTPFEEFFEQVMPDETAEFAADFNCATTTDETIGPDTTLTRYVDCDGGVEVRFYAVEGGGHTWPGSPIAALLEPALGYATDDVDATEDAWAFMSQYSLSG